MWRQPTRRQQLLLRWGLVSLAAAVTLVAAVFWLPSRDAGEAEQGGGQAITSILRRKADAGMLRFRFEEVREAAGIDFRHFPSTRASLLPEDMGSGLAWGDYDNDGDPDLFLVNFAGSLSGPGPDTGGSALYRNGGDGTFTDVTAGAGLAMSAYGMAAAWGDYDDDDDLDLYVSSYGPDRLYRNEGDGTFTDATAAAGVGSDGFSAGVAWGDYDNDGHIDLYVTSYVRFDYIEAERKLASRQYGSEIPYTINPSTYPPAANLLYRNNGDGTFSEVAAAAGVDDADGRSLGAAWFDFDDDGWPDLYVANDVSANGVFHNNGDGTFTDIGAASLAADYRGAMGLAVGDYDHDSDLDLFVSHWVAQENAFFENMTSEGLLDAQGGRRLFFMDNAELAGLGQVSLQMVGWAAGLADLDNDAWLDLWVVNGNTMEEADDNTRLKPQHMQLFRQEPGRGFFEVGRQACAALEQAFVGRGGAHADYDGDGRMDIAVMAHGGQPLLLRNVSSGDNHWLAVRLRQRGGNTRALGARVTVDNGSIKQTAQAGAEGSYLSQHGGDLHFGLGEKPGAVSVTVRWPDGHSETHTGVATGRVVEFVHDAVYP